MGLLERTKVVVCRHAPSPSPQSAPLAALAALFSPKSQRLESHMKSLESQSPVQQKVPNYTGPRLPDKRSGVIFTTPDLANYTGPRARGLGA